MPSSSDHDVTEIYRDGIEKVTDHSRKKRTRRSKDGGRKPQSEDSRRKSRKSKSPHSRRKSRKSRSPHRRQSKSPHRNQSRSRSLEGKPGSPKSLTSVTSDWSSGWSLGNLSTKSNSCHSKHGSSGDLSIKSHRESRSKHGRSGTKSNSRHSKHGSSGDLSIKSHRESRSKHGGSGRSPGDLSTKANSNSSHSKHGSSGDSKHGNSKDLGIKSPGKSRSKSKNNGDPMNKSHSSGLSAHKTKGQFSTIVALDMSGENRTITTVKEEDLFLLQVPQSHDDSSKASRAREDAETKIKARRSRSPVLGAQTVDYKGSALSRRSRSPARRSTANSVSLRSQSHDDSSKASRAREDAEAKIRTRRSRSPVPGAQTVNYKGSAVSRLSRSLARRSTANSEGNPSGGPGSVLGVTGSKSHHPHYVRPGAVSVTPTTSSTLDNSGDEDASRTQRETNKIFLSASSNRAENTSRTQREKNKIFLSATPNRTRNASRAQLETSKVFSNSPSTHARTPNPGNSKHASSTEDRQQPGANTVSTPIETLSVDPKPLSANDLPLAALAIDGTANKERFFQKVQQAVDRMMQNTQQAEVASGEEDSRVTENSRKQRHLFLLLLLAVVVGGGVATFILLRQQDKKVAEPSQQVVVMIYEPPSEEDCRKVREQKPVTGQEDMAETRLAITIEVEYSNEEEFDDVFDELVTAVQGTLVPELAGCTELNRRGLLQWQTAPFLRRELQGETRPYPIANVIVTAEYKRVESCSTDTVEPCRRAIGTLYLVLFVRNGTDTSAIIPIVEDVFEVNGDQSLADKLELSGDGFELIRLLEGEDGELIYESTSAPSGSASNVPSIHPSSFPSMAPSANRNGVPDLMPTTAESTPSPSGRPTIRPTLLGTSQPTPFATVGLTAPPTLPLTPAPIPSPTRTPTPGPTPLPTPGPTPDPSPSPTNWPTQALTPGPTMQSTPTPTAAPSLPPPGSVPTMAPVNWPTLPPPPVSLPTTAPVESPTLPPTTASAPTTSPVESPPTDNFCCSTNYKDCNFSGWCTENKIQCEVGCGASWIEQGKCSGIPLWGDCTNDVNNCCAPSTCQGDAWNKQCL